MTENVFERDPKDSMKHIVNPKENPNLWIEGMRSSAMVELARIVQQPVTALCGHTWTPSRGPAKGGMCPECFEIGKELLKLANE